MYARDFWAAALPYGFRRERTGDPRRISSAAAAQLAACSSSARPSLRRALPGSTDTCSTCRQPSTMLAIRYPAGSSASPVATP